jgi:hypothetical protein
MIRNMHQIQRSTSQCGNFFRLLGQLAVLLVLLTCGTKQLCAQLSTADIVGTISDSLGAVVPGANITLTNRATQDKRVAQSNASGDYQFTMLPTGHYSITVRVTGFKTSNTPDLAVEAGDRARNDVHLIAGGATETVTVEATTPLLQSDNATVSSTVTEAAVQDLPLNGRNFVQLVQLVPGANEGPGNGLTSGGRPDDRRTTNGFSVNGQDDILNNYIVDGIDDNERVIGTIGIKPSVEGIQEISVQTNSYAPEAGRTAGGVVNLVTKSGSNKFHGTAYEFFRNDKLDSRDFFFTAKQGKKPELRQNQFGGSFGGPIFHDKTFFFADYEGLRLVKGMNPYNSSVPNNAEYNAINAATTSSTIDQVFPALFKDTKGNPLTTSVNGIPTKTPVDKITLNYLKLYPTGNSGENTYVTAPNKTQFGHTLDTRVDHAFNQNNHIFFRLNYNKVSGEIPAPIGAGANPNSGNPSIVPTGNYWDYTGPATDKAYQYALGYTRVFSQNLVVDLRAAYTRVNNFSQPNNYNTNADETFGLPANGSLTTALTPTGVGNWTFSPLGDGAYVPLQDIDGTYQYSGTVSYTISSHNVKLGAGIIRRQARNLQSSFPYGDFEFGLATDCVNNDYPTTDPKWNGCLTDSKTYTKSDQILASTLAGAFASTSYNANIGAGGVVETPDYRTWEPSFFIQDNWKISPKLTVTYGIRYDVYTPFSEAHNKISNFDFNSAVKATTQEEANAALKVPGQNGVSATAGIQTDHTGIGPRVGFSYSLRPTTVLRGGFGISYFPGNYTANADLKNVPWTTSYGPACVSTTGAQYFTNYTAANPTNKLSQNPGCGTLGDAKTYQADFDKGLPTPAGQNINTPALGTFFAEDPKLKNSVINQFNLQVEQQFGPNVLTIGYVGNIGQHLPELFNDINVPTPTQFLASKNDASTWDAPRPLGQGYTGTGGQVLTGNNFLPNIGQIKWLASEGTSNYNALQASFQRRLAKGLAFDANYTWGHALSDVIGFSQEGYQGWGDADPTQVRKIEYGNAENDIRSRFALSVNYDLPFKNFSNKAEKAVLGGWQVNAIVAWQTGKPASITNSGTTSNWANSLHNGGSDRPDKVGDPFKAGRVAGNETCTNFPTSVKGGGGNSYWFNPCAFATQAKGTVGNVSRNSIYGPQFRHVDFSLFKDFPIYNTLMLQFRAEAYNISNTPNFFLNNNINDSSAGAILGKDTFGMLNESDPNNVPRTLQFALKLQF